MDLYVHDYGADVVGVELAGIVAVVGVVAAADAAEVVVGIVAAAAAEEVVVDTAVVVVVEVVLVGGLVLVDTEKKIFKKL